MKVFFVLLILFNFTPSWANDIDQVLLHCSSVGDLSCVKKYLRRGANIMVKNTDQRTPLHEAAIGGHLEIVQLLIKENQTLEYITAQDIRGRTPLHWAILHGDLAIIELLIKYNTPNSLIIKDNREKTPLHEAVEDRDIKIVQMLIDKYENPKNLLIEDKENRIALYLAVFHNNTEAIKLLVKKLPSAEHIFFEKAHRTPVELAFFSFLNSSLRVIFAHSPPNIKEQIIMSCQKDKNAQQQLCEQLSSFLKEQSLQQQENY